MFITGQIIDDTELDSDLAYVITDRLIRKFTNNGTWQQAEPIRGQGPSIPFSDLYSRYFIKMLQCLE